MRLFILRATTVVADGWRSTVKVGGRAGAVPPAPAAAAWLMKLIGSRGASTSDARAPGAAAARKAGGTGRCSCMKPRLVGLSHVRWMVRRSRSAGMGTD